MSFKLKLLILPLFFPLLTGSALAQWPTDPAANLFLEYSAGQMVCSDSSGGFYLLYATGNPSRAWLDRVDRYGYKRWSPGKSIHGAFPYVSQGNMIGDGRHGAIFAFVDFQMLGNPDSLVIIQRIRAQRIDSSGNLLWGPNGSRASLAETKQYRLTMVPDNAGGCILAWLDTLDEIRLNRIDSLGNRVWGDSGFAIGHSSTPVTMVEDGYGGCIVLNSPRHILRLGPSGISLWGSGIVTSMEWMGCPAIPDRKGGVVLYTARQLDYNNGDPTYSIQCQKFDSSGISTWKPLGLILDDTIYTSQQRYPVIIGELDADGGVTIAWTKRTALGILKGFYQRVRADGSLLFPDSARTVSACDTAINYATSIVTGVDDSKIFALVDQRNQGSIYLQRVDTAGAYLWSANDLLFSSQNCGTNQAVTDGKGGIILITSCYSDLGTYAKQCSRNGILGEIITRVGQVRDLSIPRGALLLQNYPNPFNPTTIIEYSIAKDSRVSLKIYNVLGQEVISLVDEMQQAGYKTARFNANRLASGIYFYRLQAGSFTSVKKMLLMK